MRGRVAIFILGCLSGCALHLRAPELDPSGARPVEPSAEPSHLAAVVRLPLPVVAALVEQQVTEPIERTEKVGPLVWSLTVARQGRIVARAENENLCLGVPFRGAGTVSALGARLERALEARVDLCTLPHLGPTGILTLRDVSVRVHVAHSDLGAMTRPLFDGLATQLEQVAGAQLLSYLRTLEVPADQAWAPLLNLLAQDIPLARGACVRLRPQAIELGQPDVDPSALRLSVDVTALPTVEQPCAAAPSSTRPVPFRVNADLQHPKARLLLPIGLGLDGLGAEVGQALHALGRIEADDGWLEVQSVTLSSARDMLVLRAKVRGEVRDSVLWIPYTRAIDGELLLWGEPLLDDTSLRLAKVQLDLRTEHGLDQLGVALHRARLTEVVEQKLRLPRGGIEKQARDAVTELGKGLQLAGQQVPVRIDTDSLALERVRAVPGRLEVQVRFVGQIVIGDTDRR